MTSEHKQLLWNILKEDLSTNFKQNFKKRHNFNIGLYEPAFETHDYGYSLCSVVYKRYIFFKEIKYKELYTILKLETDWALYNDIVCLSHYKWVKAEVKQRNIFSKLFGKTVANLYFYYYRTLGKNKAITLGRKLKVMESSYTGKHTFPVTLDQLKKAIVYNKDRKDDV
jgi:hypothetical protein